MIHVTIFLVVIVVLVSVLACLRLCCVDDLRCRVGLATPQSYISTPSTNRPINQQVDQRKI